MIVQIPKDSDFSIHNLPYGIFSIGNGPKKIGVAIGDHLIDFSACVENGIFSNVPLQVVNTGVLNDFIALGKKITNEVRSKLKELILDNNSWLKTYPELILKQSEVEMHLPVHIGDYTDFYSSLEHATNVGVMFRDPEKALLPNWRHIPVGYHGRSSSIVISGTEIHRPCGQTLPKDSDIPIYGESKRLDFELETAFIIGKESKLGHPVKTNEALDYIFGMVLFNDWSARDIQKWEYVPLGPFLGKNFASHISAWVVPIEALEIFQVEGPKQDPQVLPYLQFEGNKNYDIQLEVAIKPENCEEKIVSRSNFKFMYWNMEQQLAHHTVNGCNIKVGDLMGSGTISGKEESSYGSMLELSWAGSKTIAMADGTERKFLNDYDTVIMRGHGEKDGVRVGFGEVIGKILPALKNE